MLCQSHNQNAQAPAIRTRFSPGRWDPRAEFFGSNSGHSNLLLGLLHNTPPLAIAFYEVGPGPNRLVIKPEAEIQANKRTHWGKYPPPSFCQVDEGIGSTILTPAYSNNCTNSGASRGLGSVADRAAGIEQDSERRDPPGRRHRHGVAVEEAEQTDEGSLRKSGSVDRNILCAPTDACER